MIIRKLDYLVLNENLKQFEVDIYQNQKLGMIYVPNNGYVFYENDNNVRKDIFIIKTKTPPELYVEETLQPRIAKNKEEFVQIIEILSAEIYRDADIKEYEKKHPEYLFMEIFDNLSSGNCSVLTSEDPFYKIIDEGFLRLEVDQLRNFAKSTTNRVMNTVKSKPHDMAASNSLDQKLKNFNDQQNQQQ